MYLQLKVLRQPDAASMANDTLWLDSLAWGIDNPPGALAFKAQDVRVRASLSLIRADGAPVAEEEVFPFQKDDFVEEIHVDIRSDRNSPECLRYAFRNCWISAELEMCDYPQDSATRRHSIAWQFSFAAAQIEWRWISADGESGSPASLDMQRGAFSKGTAVIDLVASGKPFDDAVDVFLRLPGIHGSTVDRDHRGWLDVRGFRLSIQHRAASNWMKPDHIVEVERQPDQLSPRLADACIQGELFQDVALEVVSLRARAVIMAYRLRDCHVAGARVMFESGEASGDILVEYVELTFKGVEFNYFSSDGARPKMLHGGSAAPIAVPHSRVVPRSAFIIMWMDPDRPELEAVHQAILEMCGAAGIDAVRADDIQHSDQITDTVLERIRTSDVVIADLTGERPNVYYEVGHAHAVGKKPILVRRRGSVLHFDLAAHNVKEYGSLDELRAFLRSRLATI